MKKNVLGETSFSGTTDTCNEDSQVGTEIAQYRTFAFICSMPIRMTRKLKFVR